MALAMDKRVEKVNLVLAKHQIPAALKAQVKFELDDSGSAVPMYNSGQMQELVERLMAIALRLDADGKLEVFSFSSRAHKHGDVTEAEIPGYINQKFIPEARRGGTWEGGTNYAAAIRAAITEDAPAPKSGGLFGTLFGKKETTAAPTGPSYPAFHLFVSDGQDAGDTHDFKRLISGASKDHYFMLVGIGPASYFNLMREVADQYDNVGFVNFPNLTVSDDAMYEAILEKEALDWLVARQPKAA